MLVVALATMNLIHVWVMVQFCVASILPTNYPNARLCIFSDSIFNVLFLSDQVEPI
jgi:hypothetical protein